MEGFRQIRARPQRCHCSAHRKGPLALCLVTTVGKTVGRRPHPLPVCQFEREDLLAVESATGTAVIVRSIIGESCSDAQLADLLGAKGHDLRQLDLRK
jgi:hypothetical protein